MTAPPVEGPTLWSLAPSAFLPALVYEIGNGAIAPVIALTALDLGASPGKAGFMVALMGIGQVLGDVPASSLADRVGDRRSMILAAGLAVLALICCWLASSLVVLGLALLALGACSATFYLARQSYIAEVVTVSLRARAISTLAGSHRIGLFVGPFVGALAISLGGLRAAYLVAVVTAALTAILLAVISDVPRASDRPVTARGAVTAFQMLSEHRKVFATLGVAILTVGMVRAARQTVLPLWAAHLGISPEKTSLIFGVASAVDMALFYPSGKVMDHFGRLAIALPSMVIVGIAMMALPLAGSIETVTLVAVTMSFGNGIGTGIIMTIGADVAPDLGRIRFLSIWRVMSDTGQAAGPVVMSIVATAANLATGITAIGSVGLVAATGLAIFAPRYSAYATPKSVRALARSALPQRSSA